MEILSPAGNMDSLVAAVRSGADAVYVGLKEFSARRNADNFDLDGFRRAAEYCHIRGVKIYAAINIMIKEKELPSAVTAAVSAVNAGADALIVSDLGLISVLHKALPQVPLHASTQMTVHSPAALAPLKRLGIKRVVLGREMSRDEIRNFCAEAKKTGIETEVFVHGALCMCVSGKCLLSGVLGGRSGNRGLCAGPCRLEFSSSGSGRYDLSLKDLSLLSYVKELEQTGVASAKIEGRMKRPEYVAAATAAYKAALENRADENLETALKNVFSRSGFTDGYYKGETGAGMFGVRTKDDAEISKSAYSFLHSLYRSERQSVPIDIKAVIKAGAPACVTVSDKNGNSAGVYGAVPAAAQKHCTDKESVAAALSRLGGTPYFAESVSVDTGAGLYLSTAQLNGLRRKATAALDSLRAKCGRNFAVTYAPKNISADVTAKSSGGRIFASFLSADSLPENLTGADGAILPLFEDFSRIKSGVLKIASLPRYITDEQKIYDRLCALKKQGVSAAYCDNLSALALAEAAGLKIIASNGFNCAGTDSINALSDLGCDLITLSAEVYLPGARNMAALEKTGIFAYGRLPLMLTKNCPVKNTKTCAQCGGKSSLTDRMGKKFPVRCRDGYSEIFNSAPLYLADKREDINRFGFIILGFTDESPETARKIIAAYKSGAAPDTDFTRGLYYKNIP